MSGNEQRLGCVNPEACREHGHLGHGHLPPSPVPSVDDEQPDTERHEWKRSGPWDHKVGPDTCTCGKGWPCPDARAADAHRVQPQPDELRAALEAIVAHTERPAAWTWDDRMKVRGVAMAALAASPAVPGSGLNPGEVVAFPNEVHDLHGGSWEAEVGLNYWVPTTDFIHPCATRFVCRPRLAASPATETEADRG